MSSEVRIGIRRRVRISDAGAASFCNGTSGCTGLVNNTNSLIGGSASDGVGIRVTALSNGNYVVGSPSWTNPAGSISDVGAVTWCNGTSGCSGTVAAANSLVGNTSSDLSGFGGITAISNGNYYFGSPFFDNPAGPVVNAGAISYGFGTGGPTGSISTTNSVVGAVPNSTFSVDYDSANGLLFVGRGSGNLVSIFDPGPPPSNCSYFLSSSSANANSAGGVGSVDVTVDSGCDWTAVSNDSWISVTGGASGNGNGSVGYSVAANHRSRKDGDDHNCGPDVYGQSGFGL